MNLLDLLDDAAAGGAYVSFSDGPFEQLSRLWFDAHSVSRDLRARIADHSPVGLVMDNSRDAVVALLGALLSERPVVSLVAPSRGQDLWSYAESLASTCSALNVACLSLPDEIDPAFRELLSAGTHSAAFNDAPSRTESSSPATSQLPTGLIQFSSGTTRAPSGVALTLEQLAANVEATLAVLDPQPGVVASSWLPLSHDMGLVGMLLMALVGVGDKRGRGGTVYIDSPASFLRDPLSWMSRCSQRGVGITAGPLFALELTERVLSMSSRFDGNLAGLEHLIVGAEPLRADALHRADLALRTFGLSETAICPAYGLAEVGLAVTMKAAGSRWTSVETARGAMASSGQVLEGYTLVCGAGEEEAEVVVAGPSLGRAVLADGSLAAATATLSTGDVGITFGDEVVVLGRNDDMVKVGGRKVYLDEVDVVANLASRAWQTRAVSYRDDRSATISVGVEESTTLNDAQWTLLSTRIVHEVVAAFGIRPERVVRLTGLKLPRTASGKPQREQLKKLVTEL